MMIPTVPPDSPFWQDLARCDYFSESQENDGSDICKVVGDSPTSGWKFFGKDKSTISPISSKCRRIFNICIHLGPPLILYGTHELRN